MEAARLDLMHDRRNRCHGFIERDSSGAGPSIHGDGLYAWNRAQPLLNRQEVQNRDQSADFNSCLLHVPDLI
jgi:hypothetical protein